MRPNDNVAELNRLVRDAAPEANVTDWRDLLTHPEKMHGDIAKVLDRCNGKVRLNLPADYVHRSPHERLKALYLWMGTVKDYGHITEAGLTNVLSWLLICTPVPERKGV